MKTTDIEALTNSTMQALEKEFRKNDIGGAFHRAYVGNRKIMTAMVAMIVADHLANEGKPQETK